MIRTNIGSAIPESNTYRIHSLFLGRGGGVSSKESRKRFRNNCPSSECYSGPWSRFENDEVELVKLDRESVLVDHNSDAIGKQNAPFHEDVSFGDPGKTSIFHGMSTEDWNGNSWIVNNSSGAKRVPPPNPLCSLPRRNSFTWKGHTKGVHAVDLFPNSGHMLLSGSMDSSLKIWNVFNGRECMMTYLGHSLGVRDAKFAFGGSKFYSCSFDTNVHLWDTETGKVVLTFSNNSLNYSIAVQPRDNNSIILANHNKKVLQFDALSGKLVLEYNEHLGPVSAVSFCEDGNKFITSSDDRKIFVWNFGIPVVDKYASGTPGHAVPAIRVHPSGKFFVGQSMNNSIVSYQAFGEYRRQSNKTFFGHSNSGYAIQPGFSSDGKFIMSGSSDGKLYFWDWKTAKIYRNFQAHDGVCMGSLWHPAFPSQILTWGWDGAIKLWE